MQVQGSLRRVSEPLVVSHATYGKQMQNIQDSTCHCDYGRIIKAVLILKICEKPEKPHVAAGSHTSSAAERPMIPVLRERDPPSALTSRLEAISRL